ncbi:MAG: hypothetical protein ACRDQ0_14035, partial [Pseudonocardia sp.]
MPGSRFFAGHHACVAARDRFDHEIITPGANLDAVRLGVLDVGSNTVHLLLVDAHRGARPLPAYKQKTDLRLVELLDDSGSIGKEGARRLVQSCRDAVEAAEDKGATSMLAFATSALREAVNGTAVLDRVRDEAGV